MAVQPFQQAALQGKLEKRYLAIGPDQFDHGLSKLAVLLSGQLAQGAQHQLHQRQSARHTLFRDKRSQLRRDLTSGLVEHLLDLLQLRGTDFPGLLFIGHPVIADCQAARILVSWMQPKRWYVEVHNPTDTPLNVSCRSHAGWPFFTFHEKLDLAAGTSRVWTV